MIPEARKDVQREALRRDLVRKYVRLQHELVEADPMSSTYQASIQAFRQMGYTLITSGFEDELDRLLRLRVIQGARIRPAEREERQGAPELLLLERRTL
jgi:hypothetical protein